MMQSPQWDFHDGSIEIVTDQQISVFDLGLEAI